MIIKSYPLDVDPPGSTETLQIQTPGKYTEQGRKCMRPRPQHVRGWGWGHCEDL